MTGWNQFRGDGRNSGRRSELEGPERLETAWTADPAGAIRTDPVLDRAAVYVGTDRALYAFGRKDGHRRWVLERLESAPVTPVVTRDRCFVATTGGAVFALEATTGDRLWETALAGDLDPDAALTVADDLLVVGTSAGVTALETTTGDERWSREATGGVVGSPAVDDGRVYVGTTEQVVHAYDLDGEGDESEERVDAGPAAEPGTDEATSRGALDASKSISLDAMAQEEETDSSDARWTAPINGTIVDAPTVDGGRVYVADDAGRLFSLDGETGQTYFTYETDGAFTAAPTVVGDAAFVAGDDNYVHIVETSFGTRKLRGWLFSKKGIALDSAIRANPVVAGDVLCASDADGTMYGIDVADPDFEWQFGLESPATSTPAVAEGRLYVGCADDRLYCLSWVETPDRR
ncbi:PQQ-binding-like beta-propeller repeat protein [Natrononativus amylolyticus]|uniref:outer membrane protein assembly factor BamB family protein n=1 Tax=Natrononativus amylolyticus TaxID=2963434 RepID=UPI0020CB6C69|nr:PQQ-binding-like beta-propeller repeat protein [Natrononativus amylolyticus]